MQLLQAGRAHVTHCCCQAVAEGGCVVAVVAGSSMHTCLLTAGLLLVLLQVMLRQADAAATEPCAIGAQG